MVTHGCTLSTACITVLNFHVSQTVLVILGTSLFQGCLNLLDRRQNAMKFVIGYSERRLQLVHHVLRKNTVVVAANKQPDGLVVFRRIERMLDLRILDKLLGKITFIGRHRDGKIRLCAPFSLVKVGREPIQKHIPAPAVLDRPLNIEKRLVTVALAFVDNEHVMTPRNPYQI